MDDKTINKLKSHRILSTVLSVALLISMIGVVTLLNPITARGQEGATGSAAYSDGNTASPYASADQSGGKKQGLNSKDVTGRYGTDTDENGGSFVISGALSDTGADGQNAASAAGNDNDKNKGNFVISGVAQYDTGTSGQSGSSGSGTVLQDDPNVTETRQAPPTVLREADYNDWRNKAESSKYVYVNYNEEIAVKGTRAFAQISNPVYSSYNEYVKIYSARDNSTVYYYSELLKPGTVLEAIKLAKIPSDQREQVVLEFEFYNNKGEFVGRKLEGATMFREQ